MHARYGITEDYVVKEAASVLKGLLEAYPEYRTTPFFLKLVRVHSARDLASLVGGTSSLRNALTYIFLFVGRGLLAGRSFRQEPLGHAKVATEGERCGPRTRFRLSRTHLHLLVGSLDLRAAWLRVLISVRPPFQSSTSIRRRRRLCHQCKELSSTAMDHQKCGDCRKYGPPSTVISSAPTLLTLSTIWPLLRFYCADCLDKYGIKLSTVKGTPWVCLACEGLCTCKACLKVRVATPRPLPPEALCSGSDLSSLHT
jgi:hypothetical protein